MDIERLPGSSSGRTHAAAFGPLVFAVATSKKKDADLETQANDCFSYLDSLFEQLGAARGRVLSVTVYLADLEQKAALDKAWWAWVGDNPAHWPQRCCIGATLAPGCLVEMTAVAARG